MASRFEIVDVEHVEVLKDKSENETMKNSTEYWKNVSKKWTNERNFQANLKGRCPRHHHICFRRKTRAIGRTPAKY